ncbi:hypothetical protein J2X69_005032 [Algoriphagus sp. 4150]|uniref:hypothetical protein n=1 Tax=Algoriphagus sp. 4150 TaxID=2817756 RepID=UPI0028593752|nr:hypothetical protein [Algoriphagus sp. 4150]MDR7132658.1 hypothetical protein [Algoriphagus sp. 4150]
MRPTPPIYSNLFRTVRELGNFNLRKFASLLRQKSEKLSNRSKYLILSLFLISSSVPSVRLLLPGYSAASIPLPTEMPDTPVPYFPDLKNEIHLTDSISNSTLQNKFSHD